jgi:hypothetical protein
MAAPAFQGVRTFIQSDGSSFQGHIQGDEYMNWIETKDGNIVVYNKKDQNYDYAIIKNDNLKPSGKKYTKTYGNNLRKAYSFQPISREKLYELWTLKRQKSLKH